ncbi:MAG: alpha/beta fold hydrolase [Leptolyngbya sp. BL-A-14]
MTNPNRKSEIVAENGVEIETYIDGDGPAFILLPSYGRDGGEDYDAFTAQIVEAGWKVLRPQPRGIAGSNGPMTGVTLQDLAHDVACCIKTMSGSPSILLGHAFGHAVARVVATEHPDVVRGVILAASQASKVPEPIAKTPFIAGDPSAPETERLDALRTAFFAPNHDPSIWLRGWYPKTLKMQRTAAQVAPPSTYLDYGHVPLLEVFGQFDPFKPKEYWSELRDQLGDRVATVVINDASHALFPEQPASIAQAVVAWLDAFR